MLRFSFLLGVSMLAVGSLSGCDKADDAESLPTPTICFPGPNPATCYSGKVVAATCAMGLLVDVDPAYPIGARATSTVGNRFFGNNIIAVANPASLGTLGQVGKRVYFTSAPATTPAPGICQAADGPTTPVPILALSNVSSISCDSARTK